MIERETLSNLVFQACKNQGKLVNWGIFSRFSLKLLFMFLRSEKSGFLSVEIVDWFVVASLYQEKSDHLNSFSSHR